MEKTKHPELKKIPVPHMPLLSETKDRHIESIDISERMEPLLSNPDFLNLYQYSIRTIDLLNGCTRQCTYCYADAQKPTEIISDQSIQKLLHDKKNMTDSFMLYQNFIKKF